jgi:hypothetical protein
VLTATVTATANHKAPQGTAKYFKTMQSTAIAKHRNRKALQPQNTATAKLQNRKAPQPQSTTTAKYRNRKASQLQSTATAKLDCNRDRNFKAPQGTAKYFMTMQSTATAKHCNHNHKAP